MKATLRRLRLPADDAPLPAAARAFLADARRQIKLFWRQPQRARAAPFVPSDYEAVYRALAALQRDHDVGGRLCEWGSGFGVVAGLGAMLGFDAHGIEIDGELVAASQQLLLRHRLPAVIAQGSFVPAGDATFEQSADMEGRTVAGGPSAYADLELDVDDFELVFAYPWPTEVDLFRRLFARHADHGAVLLLWSGTEGMRAWRKVAASPRR